MSAGTRAPRWLGPVLLALAGVAAAWADGDPIGWALLAGALLVLALRRTGRRVMGVTLAVLSLCMAGFAATDRPSQWVSVVAGLLAVVGAVLVVLTAASAPERPSRFERAARPVDADADPLLVWKAMDAGHDPTQADEPVGDSR